MPIVEQHHSYPEIRDIMKKSAEEQRFLYYSGKVKKDVSIVRYSYDEKMWFCSAHYKVRFGKKIYLRKTITRGFSIKNKKLYLWFGSKIQELLYNDIEDFLLKNRIEWLSELLKMNTYKSIITKTMFEKILLGKITNREDLVKFWIKYSLRDKTISHSLMRQVLDSRYIDMQIIQRNLPVFKDRNHYLESLIKSRLNNNFGVVGIPYLEDIVKQCKILDKKIDAKWSDKRFNEEHNKMTREIMGKEVEFIEHDIIDYGELPELLPEMKVLTSAKEVFIEGIEMKHCIYTNYWEDIKDKTYMCISFNGREKFTIGVRLSIKSSFIDQMYKIGNTNVSQDLREYVFNWFSGVADKFNELYCRINNIPLLI